jgi:hypothetical protein
VHDSPPAQPPPGTLNSRPNHTYSFIGSGQIEIHVCVSMDIHVYVLLDIFLSNYTVPKPCIYY